MRSSDRAIPLGDDGWHHPPAARSRSHTVSGTQDAQHSLPPDAALPTTPHQTRRSSFLASAFGKLVSTSPTYTMSPHPSLASPGESDATSSSGAVTPPPSSGIGLPPALVMDNDDEHADELHDHVHDHYAPLSRILSGKNRRSSWSPANPDNSPDSMYSASAPSSGGGVLSWINAQQKEAAAAGQPPVGLFRRLSMSGASGNAPQRPPPVGAETKQTVGFAVPERAVADTPMSASENEARLGRGMQRRGSTARRLSPMSEKLLRGHYEF